MPAGTTSGSPPKRFATPPAESSSAYQNVGSGAGEHRPSWLHAEGGGGGGMIGEDPHHVDERTPIKSGRNSAASSASRPSRGAEVDDSNGIPPQIHVGRPVAPHDVRKGCCLSFFQFINGITVMSALSVAIAEILSIVYHDLLTPQGIAIRVYGVLLCIGVIFTEMGWTQAVRETLLLQNWISRGLLYGFVGLLALEQQAERTARKDVVNWYIKGAGFSLVFLGILYVLMGILCLRRLRDQRAAAYTMLKSQAQLNEALRKHHDLQSRSHGSMEEALQHSSIVI